jgi:hypothetical protein
MTLGRGKKAAFAVTAMTLSAAGALVLLLVADLIVHQRAERSAGLNRWGYRGPVVRSKRASELRAVMLGGSTVFGYGVQWEQSIPAQLEGALNHTRPFSVVNLGFNNEGAYAFLPTLRDFAYLDYDVAILYEGYNDIPGDEGPNTSLFRHDSAVFRLTGYFPILPMYLDEKAKMLRYGGSLDAAYAAQRGEQPKTVFRPNLVDRTSATAIDTVAKMTNSLGDQLGRLATTQAPAYARVSTIGCSYPWVNYCDSIHAAVRYVIGLGKRVIVVGQPRMTDTVMAQHSAQQAMLGRMIRGEFGSDPRVSYVDLGNVVDLHDTRVTFDAMHLNADGNRAVAGALAPHVLQLVAR